MKMAWETYGRGTSHTQFQNVALEESFLNTQIYWNHNDLTSLLYLFYFYNGICCFIRLDIFAKII
jgi:hypothetical protein